MKKDHKDKRHHQYTEEEFSDRNLPPQDEDFHHSSLDEDERLEQNKRFIHLESRIRQSECDADAAADHIQKLTQRIDQLERKLELNESTIKDLLRIRNKERDLDRINAIDHVKKNDPMLRHIGIFSTALLIVAFIFAIYLGWSRA